MPIYEFKCNACENKFEKLCGFNTDGITCAHCESDDVRKLISSFYSKSVGGGSSSCDCGGCAKSSCAGCH